MSDIYKNTMCVKCNGARVPLTSNVKPQASEFYCPECHNSILMDEDEFNAFRKKKA